MKERWQNGKPDKIDAKYRPSGIIFIMIKLIRSFGWAINGLRTTWREEVNFRIEVVIAVIVLCSAYYLNFLMRDLTIIIGCIGAVLSAEILNTAVEDLCNKVEPNVDPVIGKVKDIMGGFVLLVCFMSATVGIVIFWSYL